MRPPLQHKLRLPHHARRAFSLVELLCVVGIIGIILFAAAPAVLHTSGAGKFNQNVNTVSGVLDQARQYAIAQNTYVWVAFASDTSKPQEGEKTRMAVVASRDGTDQVGWQGSKNVPNAQLDLITDVRGLPQLSLKKAGEIAPRGAMQPKNTGARLSNEVELNITVPGASSTTPFGNVVRFSPSGEARVNGAPVSLIELGLQPVKGSKAIEDNLAIIQINGLTGNNRVYRL